METLRKKMEQPRVDITINKLKNIGIETQAFTSGCAFLSAVSLNKMQVIFYKALDHWAKVTPIKLPINLEIDNIKSFRIYC